MTFPILVEPCDGQFAASLVGEAPSRRSRASAAWETAGIAARAAFRPASAQAD